MHRNSETEPAPELKAARHCEWAGVACFYALLAVLIWSCSSNTSIDLHALGVPQALETLVGVSFYASWPIAGLGLLLRACELKLEARAQTPEQKKALHKVNVFRRIWAGAIFAMPVLALGLGRSTVASNPMGLLLLLVVACSMLSQRVDEMVRHILL